MAATLTQDRFEGPEWLFERKYDGIRLLAFRRNRSVQLFSRNRLLQNYPPITQAIQVVDADELILDGEVDWGEHNVRYHVFDILWLNGRDLTKMPLMDRRAALRQLKFRVPLEHVGELTEPKPWEHACREGWEGVIAKRRDSVYEHRRSPHWLKMKCEASQELVVGGFTDPEGSRKGFGALLLGYFENDEFVFAGKVGTGFDSKQLLAIRERLEEIEIHKSPFTKAVGLPRKGAHWVRPELVVQVAFIEWTTHGKLRHGRFLGIRQDKASHEVIRER
jgi:bifunctional non-homologous end joining protein LigD